MNLTNLFEGAIDDLERRRIEDLEAKMDDLAHRARESKDPKVVAALRHEFAKAKAERDSYHYVKEWEDTAPGHDATQTELRPVDEAGSPAQQAAIAIAKKKEQKVDEHGGGGVGPREWHNYVKAHRTDEGWQDFNKVEPYEVCLAGKPVKTFDYYEEARRFHDNWKQKLYREGNKEKADKITLNPVMKEGSMADAEHHDTGPEFTGYWKGTDSATPGNKMVGGAAESVEVDEMTYRNPGGFVNWVRRQGERFADFLHDPEVWSAAQDAYDQEMAVAETAPKAAMPRNFVVKNMKQSGQGKHKDAKRAMKQGDVKHKARAIPMDMEEGAKVDRMAKHIEKSEKALGHSKKDAEAIAWATLNKRGYLDNANKKKHNESVNFMEWAVAQGNRFPNFASNPAVYAQAKEAFLAEGFGTALANVSSKISGHPRKMKSAQQIRNKAMKFAPQPVAEDELTEFDAALQAMGGIGGLLKEYGVPLMAFAAVAAAYGISQAAKTLEQSESKFAQLVHKAVVALDKESIHSMAAKLHNMALAEDKIKGADGKACWKGYRYAGTENGKDKCIPVKEDELEEDWQKANKKDKTDGMSKKAVKAYRREHPGSKLQTAVTTKPSKLKKGSKASKRRSSYCSRSKGQMKMHNISCRKTPDKAICKARRRWNCEGVENLDAMLAEAIEKGTLQPGQYYIWEIFFDDGSKKRVKVTKDNFDPKAYYAKKNQVVINVEYNWEVHQQD